MTESTVTIKHDDQRQILLKEVEMKISRLRDASTIEARGTSKELLGFKVFLSVKGSHTLTKSDIMRLRELLD